MKKVMLLMALVLIGLVISPAFVAADGQGQQTQNQGDDDKIQTQTGDSEDATPELISEPARERTRARNMSELGEIRSEKQQELLEKFAGQTNQNQVRLAVHTLLAMENLTGGIGKNVSAIAREFNNSIQSTIRAEERIQHRSRIRTAFFGGDTDAADDIEAETNRNQARIQLLKQYKEQCSCSEEVKAMIQEQITAMEQEQTRLKSLAQQEKAKKGLLGWLKRSK